MPKRVILDKQDPNLLELTEAQKVAIAWDKAMRRAFKGVVQGGRPTARRLLMRSPLNGSNDASAE